MKINLLFLFVLMTGLMFAQTAITPQGSGTQDDPYLIANLGNLFWLREYQIQGYYSQTANINASETRNWFNGAGWLPIDLNYTLYDGNNFCIDSLYINRPNLDHGGLISQAENSCIKNLKVTNAEIYAASGAVIVSHLSESLIYDCISSGEITTSYNRESTGGICGRLDASSMSNCVNLANVTGGIRVGGVVATVSYSSNDLSNLRNYGTVSGYHIVGGVIGVILSQLNIINCNNYGNVFMIENSAPQFSGGIIGYSGNNINFKSCVNYGDITGYYKAAGILGSGGFNEISECSNLGNIHTYQFAGGLTVSNNDLIKNCYSTGNIIKLGNYYPAGYTASFISYNSGTVQNCYSSGAVINQNEPNPVDKGFIGENTGTTENCYFDMQTSGQTTGNGATGKTTVQMQDILTYQNWDFNHIWNISSNYNNGYPYLINGDKKLSLSYKINSDNSVSLTALVNNITNISSYGFCYNTTGNPNTQNSLIISDNLIYDHMFNANLNNLSPNQFYFIKSFVIDNAGLISYSNQKVIFIKPDSPLVSVTPAGNGFADNPYLITSPQNLLWVSQNPTSWFMHFKLMNDINFSSVSRSSYNFTPIGNYSTPFHGNFNGQNHKISNLYIINPDSDYQALFGNIDHAYIYNIKLDSIHVQGHDYSGILVGKIDNAYAYYIKNCNITNSSVTGNNYVGAIAYISCAQFKNVKVENIVINANNYAGGLSGITTSNLSNCSVKNATINGNNYLGGLTGYLDGAEVTLCNATGFISGNDYLGGLIAYAEGFVNTNNDTNRSIIDNCYSRVNITASPNAENIGSLLGTGGPMEFEVMRSYASGKVLYTNGSNPENKGFIGYTNGSGALWNYFDSEYSEQTIGYGAAAKTTAQMKQISTYYGFDFSELWDINPSFNDGYPFQRWETNTTDNDPSSNLITRKNKLNNPYPNPFNPSTSISFSLDKPAKTEISIYNIKGQKVRTLLNKEMPAGSHSVTWNGKNKDSQTCSNGIYLIKMHTPGYSEIKKATIMK